MGDDIVLVIVVATALAFDFTNGFHDTANVVDLFDWRDAPCLPGRQVPQDQSERVGDDPARARTVPQLERVPGATPRSDSNN